MSTSVSEQAVLYLRASTDRQDYSTSHQRAALRDYAKRMGFTIVEEYVDEARSGLTLAQRPALTRLLTNVENGEANFRYVLVYDVSRWGRFQDVDESAYYEFACRRAGITVAYAAESFANDGSPLAAILKGLKRAMAAEYSRELSDKVFRAQCRLTAAGFKQGGTTGYGLRRMAVGADGQVGRVLDQGERKPRPTDRVVFVHGPAHEVAIVGRIFEWYVEARMMDTEIAARLNGEGVLTETGQSWTSYKVKSILTNSKYVGLTIFNRRRSKLRSRPTLNDRHEWIESSGSFDPLISVALFERARKERERRRTTLSDEALLQGLREAAREHGTISASILATAGLPAPHIFEKRFGGLVKAFAAAGVAPLASMRAMVTRATLRRQSKNLRDEVLRCCFQAGRAPTALSDSLIEVSASLRISVQACRSRHDSAAMKWRIAHPGPKGQFAIAALMDAENRRVLAFMLIGAEDFRGRSCWPSISSLSSYRTYSKVSEIFGL